MGSGPRSLPLYHSTLRRSPLDLLYTYDTPFLQRVGAVITWFPLILLCLILPVLLVPRLANIVLPLVIPKATQSTL
jgi:hypothetical protein